MGDSIRQVPESLRYDLKIAYFVQHTAYFQSIVMLFWYIENDKSTLWDARVNVSIETKTILDQPLVWNGFVFRIVFVN